MAKFGTETQYAIWNSKKAIALQYQKDATCAYMAYLEVQKLTDTLARRSPDSTEGTEALNATLHLFNRFCKIYIAACDDTNDCIGKFGLVDAVYTSPFDFHSLVL